MYNDPPPPQLYFRGSGFKQNLNLHYLGVMIITDCLADWILKVFFLKIPTNFNNFQLHVISLERGSGNVIEQA